MTKTLAKMKGRVESGPYIGVSIRVLQSDAFRSLSANAKRLLFDLFAQYRFAHNGDVSASRSVLEARGWKSHSALDRALRELLDAGLIQRTRQGGRHRCSLYGFTWIAIDACDGKLDVPACPVPSGLWREWDSKKIKVALPQGHRCPRAGTRKPVTRATPAATGPQHGPIATDSERAVARAQGPFQLSPCAGCTPGDRLVKRRAVQVAARRSRRLCRGRIHPRGGMEKNHGTSATGPPLRFALMASIQKP